ncbi:hypothetical protein BN946_scf185043.g197 [Trametes cinnabarina]|uniref:Uncharacterized protein n=1 Tax=Pycnoporus cinnabarinus TaxID=5643 RepID=A0A060SI01_PYCCI|nr:hypothetical protein BN946_scf185043.g197 [Trametes cinnabarina]
MLNLLGSSSSHLGAIVGGAVGGVISVIIAVVLATFCVLRHWRKASVQIPQSANEELVVDVSSSAMPLKLYDPDDPSTYPPPLSEITRVPAPTFRPHPLIQSTVLPR